MENGTERPDEYPARYAAAAGKWEAVKWFSNEAKVSWDQRTDEYMMTQAAIQGKIDAMEWLKTRNSSFSNSIDFEAAAAGQMASLEWLSKQSGFKWHGNVCGVAAGRGDLKMLKFLRGQGAEFNDFTSKNAAKGGNVEVLQFCLDGGCPFNNEECCAEAVKFGKLDALKWMKENLKGVEFVGNFGTKITIAALEAGNNMDLLQWLKDIKCPFPPAPVAVATRAKKIDVLYWLYKNPELLPERERDPSNSNSGPQGDIDDY